VCDKQGGQLNGATPPTKKGPTLPAPKFVANKPNEPPIDCGSKHRIMHCEKLNNNYKTGN